MRTGASCSHLISTLSPRPHIENTRSTQQQHVPETRAQEVWTASLDEHIAPVKIPMLKLHLLLRHGQRQCRLRTGVGCSYIRSRVGWHQP